MNLFGCGHVWNILPDGAIFDPTADQLGLGYDIRIVLPTDPDFKKYRYEWTDDFNPSNLKDYPELKDFSWSGKYDFDWANEIRKERGEHWHVTHPKQFKKYKKQEYLYQKGLADPKKPF